MDKLNIDFSVEVESKTLEWHLDVSGVYDFICWAGFGGYSIGLGRAQGRLVYLVFYDSRTDLGVYNTIDEAKAAAQQHADETFSEIIKDHLRIKLLYDVSGVKGEKMVKE